MAYGAFESIEDVWRSRIQEPELLMRSGSLHALPVPSWTHDHIPTRTLRGETGGAGSQFGRCDNFTSIAASRADWYSA